MSSSKSSQSKNNTMISEYVGYNTDKMVFLNAIKGDVPAAPATAKGPAPKPIKYFRIPIRTENPDGTIGNLVFAPEDLFTFGVSENKGQNSDIVNGYTLPLNLWNKEGPTERQKSFIETLKNIIEACKQHLLQDDVKRSIAKPTLSYGSLEKLDNLLYYKRDDEGNLVEGRGPTMYPKLYTRRGDNGLMTITTDFFDAAGNTLDPFSLIGKYGHTNPAIQLDNIYIGANMSIQVRVIEAQFQLAGSGSRRLLPRPKADETMSVGVTLEQAPPPSSQFTDVATFAVEEGGMNEDEDVPPTMVVPPPQRAPPKKLAARKGGRAE